MQGRGIGEVEWLPGRLVHRPPNVGGVGVVIAADAENAIYRKAGAIAGHRQRWCGGRGKDVVGGGHVFPFSVAYFVDA